ncbi:MAG TPA: hypothetical protein VF582_02215 [Allosphingosinicella sp.]|jgi:hypothetical protein
MIELGLKLRQRGAFSPRLLFAKGEAGAWYDPADLSSMFQDAAGTSAAAADAPVGLIRDKSGRGNHAIQATATARPMLRKDSSGRFYLEFDGVDDFLRATFAIAQPWDRVSALRQLSWTEFDRMFGGVTVDTGNLYQRVGSPTLSIRSGGGAPIDNSAAPLGTNAVVIERHNGAASRIGVNIGAYAMGDGGGVTPGGITLGSRDTGANAGNLRLFGLCMVGRALGDAEIVRLRRFMAGRAGIAF